MLTLLTQYSAALLLIGIALALLALRNTIRYFSQSRRARYYILREEAMRGAGRWFVASLVCIALTIGLALFVSRAQPVAEVEPLATATRAGSIRTCFACTLTRRAHTTIFRLWYNFG